MNVIRFSWIPLLLVAGSQSTARTIQVPDDFVTIQTAIDSSQQGDVVLVKPGTYFERLTLNSGITVRSYGCDVRGKLGLDRAEVTILDGSEENADKPGVTMAEGSVLDGFTVTGMGKFDEPTWRRHWDEQGENQSHDEIGRFGTPGIAISGVNCRVINNIVHHNGHTGIVIQGKEGSKCSPDISANVCYRNMGGGIGSIRGSTAIITNNICFENFLAGIGHNNASPLVTGNECYANVRAGIGVSNGASPILRSNRCFGNRRAGIGIRTGAATRPIVEENDYYENAMAGIGCAEESAPIIRNNRCYRNQLTGIGSDFASPTIINNHVYENQKSGIGISNGSEAVIIDNQCKENKLVAIGIRDGSKAFLKGNLLQRSEGMAPIIAVLEQSKVTAVENEIIGGGIAGILNQGTLIAINNKITGNNGGNGILIGKDASVTLSNNEISGYRNAIQNQSDKNSSE